MQILTALNSEIITTLTKTWKVIIIIPIIITLYRKFLKKI